MEFLEAETGCAESARLKLRQATLLLGAYAHHANNKHRSESPQESDRKMLLAITFVSCAAPLQALLDGIHRLQEKFAISREQELLGACRNVAFLASGSNMHKLLSFVRVRCAFMNYFARDSIIS